jgi:hypothetical protein
MSENHPEDCDCDPCIYSDNVQSGIWWTMVSRQVKEGYFDE